MDMDKIIEKMRYENPIIVREDWIGCKPVSNREIIDKINEIIDVINNKGEK